MNSFLFLPCNNGLGHIRRLSILANNINFSSKKIFFLLDKKKKIKFRLDKRVKKISFSNLNLEKQNKKLDLKNLKKIISDNEINKEIIFDKKKNYVVANFFWEEILHKNFSNIKNLKKKGITVFSNYLFLQLIQDKSAFILIIFKLLFCRFYKISKFIIKFS